MRKKRGIYSNIRLLLVLNDVYNTRKTWTFCDVVFNLHFMQSIHILIMNRLIAVDWFEIFFFQRCLWAIYYIMCIDRIFYISISGTYTYRLLHNNNKYINWFWWRIFHVTCHITSDFVVVFYVWLHIQIPYTAHIRERILK